MRNRYKSAFLAVSALLLLAACSPQEFNDHELGRLDTISEEMIQFTHVKSPASSSDNVILFSNTTELTAPHSLSWDLGNGVVTKGNPVIGQYPKKGDYEVSLTIYTADGAAAKKTQTIHIANDDFGLIDTPVYRMLTGGMDDADGKTWVFDQYNNFTAEVGEALQEKGTIGNAGNIKGHLGLGPQFSYSQEWWGAGANEKAHWMMYDFKFTFTQEGTRLNIQNSGEGYGRTASAAGVGGFNVTSTVNEDVIFTYAGGTYSFSIDETTEKFPTITLSGDAFMGYYCGSQVYDIIYQTDKAMALRVNNTVEGQDWVFIYCLEEYNTDTPAVEKELKAITLFDDFEGNPQVPFVGEEMGSFTASAYQNPAPVPMNESSKVYLYHKSAEFYSNLSFVTEDYTFDLSEINKIRMKVFIPSYNDYETEYEVAGDWISNKRLLKQVAVKLQDSTMGGNAWQTQTEIVLADLEMDKWIDLEFDFSAVADRKDYDKIVIQFGAEGHRGTGIFFFDDFSFDR